MLFCPSKKHVAPFRERSETLAGGMNKSSFYKQSPAIQTDNLADTSLLKTGSTSETLFPDLHVFNQDTRPLRVL